MRRLVRYVQSRRGAIINTVLIGTLVLASGFWITGWYARVLSQELHTQVTANVSLQSAALESALSRRFAAIQGISAFVETTTDESVFSEHLDTFLASLYRTLPPGTIRNIAIAPDSVTRYSYPHEGNERVLGYNPLLDLRADVRREAQLAITSRRLIVTGPLELVQGGRGLILRQAVYRGPTYWGLVSIVVDLAPLLQEAQFLDDPAICSVLLRSADGTPIYSSSQPVSRDPVQHSIPLPDGSWELLMTPTAGWDAALSGALRLAWVVIAGFAVLAMALAYVLSNRHDLLREAVRQRTRDLRQLNRRLQTDIVRRQRIEAALRESEERYRLIAENSTDLIAIFNDSYEFVYASPSYAQVLAADPAALIGKSLLMMVHPDDLPVIHQMWSTSGAAEGTFRQHHQSGTWCWLEASLRTTTWRSHSYCVCVARDSTRRRELEERLWQAQKMESLGQLAGGVAHDFNNVLTAIAGYASLATETLAADNPVRSDLNEIERSVQRAVGFTRRLLAFARRQMIAPRVLDLNLLIRDMAPLLVRLIGGQNQLELTLAALPGHVRADPSQIEQVLLNLVVNARDAMPSGGTVHITTRNRLATPESLQSLGEQGQYVAFAVEDTGEGIAPNLLKYIFEPFFTTKSPGSGTGLGLATSYGIVRQHDGMIDVASQPGHGSCFTIYLPLCADAVDPPPPPQLKLAVPGGTETLLLVEDEPAVRLMTARILRERGYTVLQAANGRAALEVLMSHPAHTIQLVLTDVVMPEMDGHELALLLRVLYPALKIVFMSGHAEPMLDSRGWLTPDVVLLPKPFNPSALAQTIRHALDA